MLMLKYCGDGVSSMVEVDAAEKMCLLQVVVPELLAGVISMMTPRSAPASGMGFGVCCPWTAPAALSAARSAALSLTAHRSPWLPPGLKMIDGVPLPGAMLALENMPPRFPAPPPPCIVIDPGDPLMLKFDHCAYAGLSCSRTTA